MISRTLILLYVMESMSATIPYIHSDFDPPLVVALVASSGHPMLLGLSFDFPDHGIGVLRAVVSNTSVDLLIADSTSNIVLRPDVGAQLSSVSILGSHQIAFNQTRPQFVSTHCLEESVLSTELIVNEEDRSVGVRVRYALMDGSADTEGHSIFDFPTYDSTESYFVKLDVSRHTALSLPQGMGAFIRGRIAVYASLFHDEGLYQIHDCDDVVAILPSIKLTFLGTEESSLVLYPEDYTTRIEDTNRCALRFRDDVGPNDAYLNPFRLAQINTHMLANELIFCDI